MKKYLFALPFIAFCSGGAHAQGIGIGIRAGANLSSLVGADTKAPRTEAIWGPVAGLIVNVPVTTDGFFSVQPELQYSRKGFRAVYSPTYYERIFLHYLELPVLAKVKVAGFVVEAGPQLGYLLDVKGNGALGSPSAPEGVDGYHQWAVGYVAGVGYELSNGLGVSVRYNGGLTNARQLPENVTPLRARNSAFQFQLSYLWRHQ